MKKGVRKSNAKDYLSLKNNLIVFVLLLFALIIIFNITDFKIPLQSPTDGLILNLNFNINQNDPSHIGTLIGDTKITTGKSGKAYYFDGTNDYMSFGDLNSLEFTDTFSVSAWVYPEAKSGTKVIASKGCATPAGWAVQLSSDNKPQINYLGQTVESLNPIPLNAWTHLTFTVDSGTLSIYANNNPVKESTGLSFAAHTTANVNIGTCRGGTSSTFKGKIDEVHIYDQALTETEVEELYYDWIEPFDITEGFTPVASTVSFLSGSPQIILFDSQGNGLYSDDGVKFNSYSNLRRGRENFPSNFNPTVMYYLGMKGTNGELYMFNTQGDLYVANIFSGSTNPGATFSRTNHLDEIRWQSRNLASELGITEKFIPTDGFYHGFAGGRIVLHNGTGSFIGPTAWTWRKWVDLPDTKPKRNPDLSLYYRFSTCPHLGPLGDINGDGIINSEDAKTNLEYYPACGDIDGDGLLDDMTYITQFTSGNFQTFKATGGAINLGTMQFYLENGELKVFEWDQRTAGTYDDITSEISGLPNEVPQTGYYDPLTNRVVLWFGDAAYGSHDARSFELIAEGTTPTPTTCTLDDQNDVCDDDEVCLNDKCVAEDLCIDEDAEAQEEKESQIGIFPNEKADIKFANGTIIKTDICDPREDNELIEWYCNEEGEPDSVNIICPRTCSGGVCEEEFDNIDCAEADSGKDYDVKSNISLFFDGEEVLTLEDECISSTKLLEFFCEDDSIKSIEKRCTSSEECVEGACVVKGSTGTGTGTGTGTTSCTIDVCNGDQLIVCASGVQLPAQRIHGKCNYYSTSVPQTYGTTCTGNNGCDGDEYCNSAGYCQLESDGETPAGLWVAIIAIIIFIVAIIGIMIFLAIKNQNEKQNHPLPPPHMRPAPPVKPNFPVARINTGNNNQRRPGV